MHRKDAATKSVMLPAVLQTSNQGLTELEKRVRQDLAFLCYPPPNWVPTTHHAAADRVYDVVVIGAGMCGLVASFALLGAGIANLRMFDRSPAGQEPA